jgi:hypothetical protein
LAGIASETFRFGSFACDERGVFIARSSSGALRSPGVPSPRSRGRTRVPDRVPLVSDARLVEEVLEPTATIALRVFALLGAGELARGLVAARRTRHERDASLPSADSACRAGKSVRVLEASSR